MENQNQNIMKQMENLSQQIYEQQNRPRYTLQVMQKGKLIETRGASNSLFANMIKNRLQKRHPQAKIFIWESHSR